MAGLRALSRRAHCRPAADYRQSRNGDSEQRLGQTLLQLARTLGKKDPRSIRIELRITHEELLWNKSSGLITAPSIIQARLAGVRHSRLFLPPQVRRFIGRVFKRSLMAWAQQSKEVEMKKLMLLSVLLTALALSGCEFIAGTLVGAGAAGGGYEYQAYRQMQQLEEDYKNKRISREEYEDRKKQIEKGSIIY